MIYLLFDNPGDSGRVSFISRLSSMEMREVFSPRRKRLIFGWWKGARDEDTLRDLLQITPPHTSELSAVQGDAVESASSVITCRTISKIQCA